MALKKLSTLRRSPQSTCGPACGCGEPTNAAAACACCPPVPAAATVKDNDALLSSACSCCTSPAADQQPAPLAQTSQFRLAGLDCADCAAKLEKKLHTLAGVSRVQVNFATAKLTISYDGRQLTPAGIETAVAKAGYQAELLGGGTSGQAPQTVFLIGGMDCGDCAAKLEKRIASIAGVQSAQVNFATSKLSVIHSIDTAIILKAIQAAGYEGEIAGAVQAKPAGRWWQNRRTQATIVSGALLALATLLDWLQLAPNLLIPLYLAATVIGGYHAAKSGLYGIRSLTFDMNFLMTVAVIGAAAIGEWSEGATVAVLFSFGNTLQTYTLDKTRQSIRALMELAPPEALVRRAGEELRLPVEEIVVGDVMIVKPGERIAMDGLIISGQSAVNQATITGESLPVEKTIGDSVYAGTVNEHGALEIEVTRIAADSTLAKIMHLVEEAQSQKAPSQQFVDVFAKYYTPIVLLAAAGIMLIPWLLFAQPFTPWFYKGLVLLVISCPCALVISTPVSIVAAIGNSSRSGVLIKGGAYLEQMGAIKAIAFDKTGTLTHGTPVVTDIVPAAGQDPERLLTLAAAVEKWSEHPLAAAIVAKAGDRPLPAASDFQALVGRGAQAVVDGETIYVGNLRLFTEANMDAQAQQATMTALEEQGKTVMLIGTTSTVLGLIAVADTLRQTAPAAVNALRQAGLQHIAMLTGDNKRVAAAMTASLNLDACYSELLPADKVTAVQRLSKDYGSVIMVGDGVNDAPALAAANIGVAMGAAASDTALETADIALMADDLGKLAYIIRLSRKTVAVIKQNIGFSVLIKLAFLIATFFGYVDLWLAVLADMGSSILVTLNGMRLMQKIS